jgi:hypothetical protein
MADDQVPNVQFNLLPELLKTSPFVPVTCSDVLKVQADGLFDPCLAAVC